MFTLLAGAVFAVAVFGQQNENLVPNASAELGESEPTGWKFSKWAEAVGQWDDTHAFHDNKSLKVTGLNAGWGTTVSVQPGSLHKFSLRYRQSGPASRIVTYVRDKTRGSKPLLYRSQVTIGKDSKSGFVDGQYVEGADQNGWVKYEAGVFVPKQGTEAVSILVKLVSKDPQAALWLDDFRVVATVPQPLPKTAAVVRRIPGAMIWTENANRKILIDQPPPSVYDVDAIDLDLARGEYGVIQIAVRPTVAWADVDWTWTNFMHLRTRVSDFGLQCRLLEYVNIDNAKKPFGRSGLHPDPLTRRLPCQIDANKNQSFWFTIKIPADQTAGIYRAQLKLNRGGKEITRVPVKVRVRDFVLPAIPSIDVVARMHPTEVRKAESGDDDEVLKRYYASYFENRTRCSVFAPIGVRLKGNVATVSADRFIDHRKYVNDQFGPRPFFLPLIWISHDKHRMPTDATWKGRKIFANETMDKLHPDFEQPFRDFANQLVAKLKREGLFHQPVARFIDEPALTHAPTVTAIRTLAGLLKSIDPSIQLSMTTTSPHPELFGSIDNWVLHTDAWQRSSRDIAAAKKSGAKIWVYNNAIAYVEQERIRIRAWPWLLKKYDVDGTYSWCGTTNWRNERANPWENGISYFEVLFYPPRDSTEQGPIESVRWQLFRQGLQDYEYLEMAQTLADRCQAASKTTAAKQGRVAVEHALALVERWPHVRPAIDRPYQRDVLQYEAARKELADAIEAMQESIGH